jgi:hypothetical protein
LFPQIIWFLFTTYFVLDSTPSYLSAFQVFECPFSVFYIYVKLYGTCMNNNNTNCYHWLWVSFLQFCFSVTLNFQDTWIKIQQNIGMVTLEAVVDLLFPIFMLISFIYDLVFFVACLSFNDISMFICVFYEHYSLYLNNMKIYVSSVFFFSFYILFLSITFNFILFVTFNFKICEMLKSILYALLCYP